MGNWGILGKEGKISYVIISQSFHMSDEGRHKINCWVPESLWEKVEYLGYDSPTKATIAGYESLITRAETQEDRDGVGNNCVSLGNDWENMGKQLEEAQKQIQVYEEKLRTAPDPSELSQLRARSEELERHNETLKQDIERAERDKEDLKTTYNNYFLQIQTLINQKAIEAPGAKKPWYKFW
jgi:SMC interacting uncharacterized protein involved in chromosome segregation